MSLGETTVQYGGRVASLDPLCSMVVSYADSWIDISELITLTTDVADPGRDRPDFDEHLRTTILGLVSMGILEAGD